MPILEVRAEHPDQLLRLGDTAIADLEFQTTRDEGDLRRFYRYNFAISEEHDTDVYTIVFYGPGIATAPDTYKRGSVTFVVQNVFIGQMDGEDVLTQIKLLPLMKHRRSLEEVVREVAELTSGLPKLEREETLGTMLGLAYNYINHEIIDQLLKEPTVANALQQLVIDSLTRGKAEGNVEGRLEGTHEAILDVLSARFGELPEPLQQRVVQVSDLAHLKKLVTTAATVTSLAEFVSALDTTEATQ